MSDQPTPLQTVQMPDGTLMAVTQDAEGNQVLIPVPTAAPAAEAPAAPAPAPQPETVTPDAVIPAPAPQPAEAPQAAPAPAPAPQAPAPAPAPETAAQPAPAAPAPVPATVAAPAPVPATVAAPHAAADGVAGLEDLDDSDLVMPTLKIVGAEGVFEDSLSGEKFPQLNVILLGVVKQRVLWPPEVKEEKEAPLCRSYNFTLGVPGEKFTVEGGKMEPAPIGISGFSPEQVASGQLACAECALKDWDSHPTRETPWCSEQHVYVVLVTEPDQPNGYPAVLTLQRSSIKPSKTYLTSYARSKQPLFTARTTISLDVRTRGTVTYSVPKFMKGAPTDPAWHPEYTSMFYAARDFVQTPRTVEEPSETSVSVTAGPAASTAEAEIPF